MGLHEIPLKEINRLQPPNMVSISCASMSVSLIVRCSNLPVNPNDDVNEKERGEEGGTQRLFGEIW